MIYGSKIFFGNVASLKQTNLFSDTHTITQMNNSKIKFVSETNDFQITKMQDKNSMQLKRFFFGSFGLLLF